VKKEMAKKLDREVPIARRSLTCSYPQVYLDLQKHIEEYDGTQNLPTQPFFFGLSSGGRDRVELEPGKALIVKYLTTSDPHDDGTRTVFFELNGQPRSVDVAIARSNNQPRKAEGG
jgi:pyruvate carboxylase